MTVTDRLSRLSQELDAMIESHRTEIGNLSAKIDALYTVRSEIEQIFLLSVEQAKEAE